MRLFAPGLAATLRAGRLVMLFDPPAALSAWALAQLGLDAEQMLVVDGREQDAARREQPVGAGAGLEERPSASCSPGCRRGCAPSSCAGCSWSRRRTTAGLRAARELAARQRFDCRALRLALRPRRRRLARAAVAQAPRSAAGGAAADHAVAGAGVGRGAPGGAAARRGGGGAAMRRPSSTWRVSTVGGARVMPGSLCTCRSCRWSRWRRRCRPSCAGCRSRSSRHAARRAG